ncbi:hypothetical protein LTR99_007721 [Exophiala xenobiotica]|uniref:Amidase domain-containing protein n=1 Tax=Vermiconidia calcicola TaxID=1690605 RepID=A0AAV9Q545_9PEZI|nr:hypothetical protein LTR41_005054 [Exophiala xenobiotica]KAK5535309.1 hypothetical protein LTR25_006317 [Vermiconidia calcicola]KAK5546810.1 hypothetical protein LTR23_003181 [Chaetothyriales sp. CCFEE 6169]KAK5273709.1 hypothetical protein LTR96_000309 [Exophiala xenobiotica]KAK5298032.1 hypothetical protein LTR99_007721 [Exophiala xenobiotica]
MSAQPWQEVVREKRDIRQKLVEPYLTDINGERAVADNVLSIDNVEDLTSLLASGKVTAHDVTASYIRRLDQYYQQQGNLIGPLHGVPVTLKDQFDVKGADSTIGYVARAFKPAARDAAIVQILKSLGAIILAKTNLPQSIMWCETENPLWGLTTNPRNPAFTPGGSTGGEGVLLALKASMIGWGTDIGGSIRIPSHMNGLWGLKPTSSRLPYMGVPVSTEGQEHVPSAIGPMTRSLSSLVTVMQNVIDAQPWVLDPKVTPIPWRQDMYEQVQTRPLTIGVLVDDGVVKVHPPIERVLKELEAKLKAAGHEIVQWNCAGHKECIEIMDLFYTADGGEDIRREVQGGGEPFIPHVEALTNRGKAISVYEYWQLNKRKIAAQQAYNDKWNLAIAPDSGRTVDVILMPTMPHPAVPHKTCKWVGYTKVWNFLDYPALSFPAGQVEASKDLAGPADYEPRNDYDAWNWKLYNPETMDGHPVGLQIVGRRFEEEKVLGVAAVMDKLMKA